MKTTLTIILTLLISINMFAQERILTGYVKDALGEPVIGATVLEIGTTNGTMVDLDGKFTLKLTDQDAKLSISFIGYKSQTIAVGTNTAIDVIMAEDTKLLDEVVITGYGTSQKRSLMTQSISKLDNKTLNNAAISNVGSALQGSVSGLRVINTSGKPGSAPNIVLRGGASIDQPLQNPLVVIDGVVRSMDDVNPSDIESIDVMKDAASTAIYGARANSGVILITTKSGKSGKGTVNYKFKGGWNFAQKGYKFLDAQDYIYYNRLGYKRSGKQGIDNQNGYGKEGGIFDLAKMTDANKHLLNEGWQSMVDPYDPSQTILFKDHGGKMRDAAYNDPSFTQDHYVSLTGGNDKGTFASSFGYYKEEGQIVSTSYERFTGKINGSYQILPILKVHAGADITDSKTPELWTGNGDGETGEYELFYRSMSMWPTWNPYLEDGSPAQGLNSSDGNPRYWSDKLSRKNSTRKTNFTFGAQIDIIPKKLVLTENSSMYFVDYQFERFDKKTTSQIGVVNDSRVASFKKDKTERMQHNATLTYTERFAEKHNINVMVGGEYFQNRTTAFSGSGQGAPTDDIPTLNTASEENKANSSKSEHKIMSMFSRINYDYQGKYLLSLVGRYDGVSKLWDNRWGFFPGASAGWNVQEEDFFKSSAVSKYMNIVKPRVSYGVNGNIAGLSDFEVYGLYKTQTPYNENLGFLNTDVMNNLLKWEKSKTLGIGLDLGFMDNRLGFILDYYNRTTDDLLTQVDLPGYTGFNKFRTNLGSIQNSGFEVEVNYEVLPSGGDFRWNISANAAFVKNKIKKLPYNGLENNRQGGYEVYDPKSGQNVWVGGFQEGGTLGEMFAYKQDGIFQNWEQIAQLAGSRYDAIAELYGPTAWANLVDKTGKKQIEPGDVIWADLNNDGVIDSYDRVKVGNMLPKWTGGFSTTLEYKNFSLYTRFDFATGHTLYNDLKARTLGQYQGTFNMISDVKDMWSEDNPTNDLPAFYYADQLSKKNITRSNNGGTSANNNNSALYEKGDYIALREVTLSYKVPRRLLEKAYISDLTLNITGQNLGYLTGYKGTSPEAALDFQANGRGGIDNGRYPLARTLLFGLQLSF